MIANRRGRALLRLAYMTPAMLIVGVLIIYPLLNGVRLSFTNASPIRFARRWVGFANYQDLLTDPTFWEVLLNSLLIIGSSTLLALILGFALALALNSGIKAAGLFRTAIFQIWIVPWIAVTILWGWLFNLDYGLVNYLAGVLGLSNNPIAWLARPATAQLVVILGFVWRTIPFMMVVSLAALQGIPKELLEAAAIDGATYFTRLRHIILPLLRLLRNVLVVVGLLQGVRMFQEITMPWVLTQGGPINAITTLSLYAYKMAFQRWEFGLASAVGTLWLAFLVVFASIYLGLFVKRGA